MITSNSFSQSHWHNFSELLVRVVPVHYMHVSTVGRGEPLLGLQELIGSQQRVMVLVNNVEEFLHGLVGVVSPRLVGLDFFQVQSSTTINVESSKIRLLPGRNFSVSV